MRRGLSSKMGGVEILQVYVLGLDGKSGYYNISYGTKSSVDVPHTGIGTSYLIDHVHPSGSSLPSKEDKDLLLKFQAIQAVNGKPVQSSSTIVPEGQNNSKFNEQTKTSN
jgi:hypothetical protein